MRHSFVTAAPTRLLSVGAAVCCALLGPVPAVAAAPPAPGLGIRLLEAPTARQADPRAHVYIVDRVPPGGGFSRRIEVSNGDTTPMDVVLYPATAGIASGAFTVRARTLPGEIPSWTSISPSTVHLAPGGRAEATVTVKVPPNTAPGEYYGGAVVERPAQSSPKGVVVALRVAIRMYLSVGPGGEPPSDFTIDSLTAERAPTGEPLVLAQVHNTGGRALDMTGQLRLSKGPGGLSAGPFNATLGTTLGIGQSEPVTVKLDKALPAGPWLARMDLASGLVRRSATATISFPDKGASAPVAAKLVQTKKKSPPWALIGIGVLILLLLLFFLWFILKRRSRPRDTRDDVVVQTPR
jgi:hypothetical protein